MMPARSARAPRERDATPRKDIVKKLACGSRSAQMNGSRTCTTLFEVGTTRRRRTIMATASTTPTSIPTGKVTDHEAQQIERSNATGLQPIVFVHGLWLLP